ncbi:putative Beta-lactamase [Seiridium unicorne]|uniref:Beta-lactamase n=1 Tax=Seiridium unicorne TaxID=138068 RepID=A0ABR2USE4_9PEZI
MHHITSLGLLLISTACAATTAFTPTDQVPLLGPSFLSNFDPTDSTAIKSARDNFPEAIDALFESNELNKTDLVFAVDVFSAATNKSIYNYYHVGEGKNETLTSGCLNDKTIARIGSISKLFTAYVQSLLKLSGSPLEHVRWEDVTIGALASQQAGSGGVAGLLVSTEQPKELQPRDLFNFMCAKHPVISPNRVAVYSDGGFVILAQVLARLSGQEYEDAIRDILVKPLRLDSTSLKAPSGSNLNAIDTRPVAETSTFANDIPIVEGSGGFYTSGANLRTATTVQQWMKPLSGTGSLVELVGAPWEIQRLAIPATLGSNRTRVSDLYTKAGGTGDYNAIFALSPDHGIGFSILVTGSTSPSARFTIRDVLGELFVPAAEAAAAENAALNLAGTFVSKTSNGTNLTLTVDEGKSGIGLASIYYEGAESSAYVLNIPEAIPINASIRLFPTGLNSYSRSLAALYKTDGTMRVAHRAIGNILPLAPRAASEGGTGGLFDNQQSWMDVDFLSTIDEFIFTIEDEKLTSVENTGARLTFNRVD